MRCRYLPLTKMGEWAGLGDGVGRSHLVGSRGSRRYRRVCIFLSSREAEETGRSLRDGAVWWVFDHEPLQQEQAVVAEWYALKLCDAGHLFLPPGLLRDDD